MTCGGGFLLSLRADSVGDTTLLESVSDPVEVLSNEGLSSTPALTSTLTMASRCLQSFLFCAKSRMLLTIVVLIGPSRREAVVRVLALATSSAPQLFVGCVNSAMLA